MSKYRAIVLVGLIIVIIAGGYFFMRWQNNRNSTSGVAAPGTTVTTAPPIPGVNSQYKPEDYQDNLKKIMDEFWQNPDRPNTVNDLLALTLPFEYQNLHLSIVQAMLEYEQTGSSGAIERLRQITDETSWL